MSASQTTRLIVLMLIIGTEINIYVAASNEASSEDQPSNKQHTSLISETSEHEKNIVDNSKSAILIQKQHLHDEKLTAMNTNMIKTSIDADLTFEQVLEKASHHPDELLKALTENIPKDKLDKLMQTSEHKLINSGISSKQTLTNEAISLTFDDVLKRAISDPEDLLHMLKKANPKFENLLVRNTRSALRKRRSTVNRTDFENLVTNSSEHYRELLKTGCRPIPVRIRLKDVMPRNEHRLDGNVEFLPPAIEIQRCPRWHCTCEQGKVCLPREGIENIEVKRLEIIAFRHTTSHKVVLDVDRTLKVLQSLHAESINSTENLNKFRYKVISHKHCECKNTADLGCAKPFIKKVVSTNKHDCICDEEHAKNVTQSEGKPSTPENINQVCKDYLEGIRVFEDKDYIDIVLGKHQEPQCTFGDFNVISKSCPKKE